MIRNLLCIGIVIVAFTSTARTQELRLLPGGQDPMDAKKVEAVGLNRMIPAMKFDQKKLSEVIDTLRDRTGANIFVNWNLLKQEGVSQETLVTLGIGQLPLRKALDLILIVAANGERKLGYSIDNGAIAVSTIDDLAANRFTRVYDIRDLITASKADQRAARVEALVKLLTDTIDAPSWKTNAGHSGDVRELQGQLIITQTYANQRQIVNLLEHLRAAFATDHPQQSFPLLQGPKKQN